MRENWGGTHGQPIDVKCDLIKSAENRWDSPAFDRVAFSHIELRWDALKTAIAETRSVLFQSVQRHDGFSGRGILISLTHPSRLHMGLLGTVSSG
jgi:hypothetical protein